MMQKNDRNVMAYIWVLIGLVGRMLPLPPNMNPMTSLSLFSGTHMDKKRAFGIALITMVISDVLLSYLKGHAAFGLWSLFTYSGFAAIILAGSLLRNNPSAMRTFGFLTASSFGFWLWTNFGIWATGDHGMYARDFSGLVACYANALPFLRNALIGDLVCGAVLFASFNSIRKMAATRGWAIQGA